MAKERFGFSAGTLLLASTLDGCPFFRRAPFSQAKQPLPFMGIQPCSQALPEHFKHGLSLSACHPWEHAGVVHLKHVLPGIIALLWVQ